MYNRSVQDFYSQFSNGTTTPACTTGQYRIFTHNSPTEQQPQHVQQVSTGFLLTILQLNNNSSMYNRSVQDFYLTILQLNNNPSMYNRSVQDFYLTIPQMNNNPSTYNRSVQDFYLTIPNLETVFPEHGTAQLHTT